MQQEEGIELSEVSSATSTSAQTIREEPADVFRAIHTTLSPLLCQENACFSKSRDALYHSYRKSITLISNSKSKVCGFSESLLMVPYHARPATRQQGQPARAQLFMQPRLKLQSHALRCDCLLPAHRAEVRTKWPDLRRLVGRTSAAR